MCCLKYEQAAYDDLLRTTPKVGTPVRTKDGRGTVVEVNLLTGMLKVAPEKDSAAAKFYPKSEVRPIRESRGEGRQEGRGAGRGEAAPEDAQEEK